MNRQISWITAWLTCSLVTDFILCINTRTSTIYRTCSCSWSCSISASNWTAWPSAPLSPSSYWWTCWRITDFGFLCRAWTWSLRSTVLTCATSFAWTTSASNSTAWPICPIWPSQWSWSWTSLSVTSLCFGISPTAIICYRTDTWSILIASSTCNRACWPLRPSSPLTLLSTFSISLFVTIDEIDPSTLAIFCFIGACICSPIASALNFGSSTMIAVKVIAISPTFISWARCVV